MSGFQSPNALSPSAQGHAAKIAEMGPMNGFMKDCRSCLPLLKTGRKYDSQDSAKIRGAVENSAAVAASAGSPGAVLGQLWHSVGCGELDSRTQLTSATFGRLAKPGQSLSYIPGFSDQDLTSERMSKSSATYPPCPLTPVKSLVHNVAGFGRQHMVQTPPPVVGGAGGLCAFQWLKILLVAEAALFWSTISIQYFSCTKRAQCTRLIHSMRTIQDMPKMMFWLTTATVFGGTALVLAGVTERLLIMMGAFVERLIYGRTCADDKGRVVTAAASSALHTTMLPTMTELRDVAASKEEPRRTTFTDRGTNTYGTFKLSGGSGRFNEPRPLPTGGAISFQYQLAPPTPMLQRRSASFPEQVNKAPSFGAPVSGMFNVTTKVAAAFRGQQNQLLMNSNYSNYARPLPMPAPPARNDSNKENNVVLQCTQCNKSCEVSAHEAAARNFSTYSHLPGCTAGEENSDFRKYIEGVKAFLKKPLNFPESPEEVRKRRRNRRSVSAAVHRHPNPEKNTAMRRHSAYAAPPVVPRSDSESDSETTMGRHWKRR